MRGLGAIDGVDQMQNAMAYCFNEVPCPFDYSIKRGTALKPIQFWKIPQGLQIKDRQQVGVVTKMRGAGARAFGAFTNKVFLCTGIQLYLDNSHELKQALPVFIRNRTFFGELL